MLLIFLVLHCIVPSHSVDIAIRTGIVQLQLDNITYASYSILFKNTLQDNSYNSLVSLSYTQNIDISKGIIINSTCSNNTVTGMGCLIKSQCSSSNTIVYMSYIASDLGSLAVGTFARSISQDYAAFSFGINNTQLKQTLTYIPAVDTNYIGNSTANFVNYYPFISGISSFDSDFSLQIITSNFDATTSLLTMSIVINQFHVQNVTIVFGYLIYNALSVSVSFEGTQQLVPGKVPKGYIYGIAGIKSKSSANNTGLGTNGTRRLMAIDSSVPAQIKTTDPANISPVIVSANQTPASKASPDRKSLIAQNVTSTTKSLRSYSVYNTKLSFTSVMINSTVFDNIAQPDGIIDPQMIAISKLQEMGLILPSAIDRNVASLMPSAKSTSNALVGIDNMQFYSLFNSNGFVILTTADDVDQIYYYEVNPVQELNDPNYGLLTPSAPSYFRSVISNVQKPLNCSIGVLAGLIKWVDYIQQKMIIQCVQCNKVQYFNSSSKSCMPFPKFSNNYNQIDYL